jgi:hypothetical protein
MEFFEFLYRKCHRISLNINIFIELNIKILLSTFPEINIMNTDNIQHQEQNPVLYLYCLCLLIIMRINVTIVEMNISRHLLNLSKNIAKIVYFGTLNIQGVAVHTWMHI